MKTYFLHYCYCVSVLAWFWGHPLCIIISTLSCSLRLNVIFFFFFKFLMLSLWFRHFLHLTFLSCRTIFLKFFLFHPTFILTFFFYFPHTTSNVDIFTLKIMKKFRLNSQLTCNSPQNQNQNKLPKLSSFKHFIFYLKQTIPFFFSYLPLYIYLRQHTLSYGHCHKTWVYV